MKKERIIYAFILLLILLLISQFLHDDADMLPVENKRYWIEKTHSKETFPVVFAGDSRVFRGISPEDFEAEYPGMSGINLGYSSNGFHPRYLDFLEERLDQSADTRIIVLGISAHSFCRRGFPSNHYKAERFGRKKEEVIQYMYFYELSRLFTPFNLTDILNGKREKKVEMFYQLNYHFNGWMESTRLRLDSTNSDASYKQIFINNTYNAEGAEMVFRRVQEWRADSIHVIAFRSPSAHSVRVLEDSLSGFPAEEFRSRFIESGGTWLDIDPYAYETYDGNHLDSRSARIFSKDLARLIKKELSAEE